MIGSGRAAQIIWACALIQRELTLPRFQLIEHFHFLDSSWLTPPDFRFQLLEHFQIPLDHNSNSSRHQIPVDLTFPNSGDQLIWWPLTYVSYVILLPRANLLGLIWQTWTHPKNFIWFWWLWQRWFCEDGSWMMHLRLDDSWATCLGHWEHCLSLRLHCVALVFALYRWDQPRSIKVRLQLCGITIVFRTDANQHLFVVS